MNEYAKETQNQDLMAAARNMDREQDILNTLKAYQEQGSILESELLADPDWVYSSKVLFEFNEGKPFEGDDQAAASYGLNEMTSFNSTFFNVDTPWSETDSQGMAEMMFKLNDAGDHQKVAFAYLYEMFDMKDWTIQGVGRTAQKMTQDPLNLVGLGLPIVFVARYFGRQAAKEAVKYKVRQWAGNIVNTRAGLTGLGAVEGAAFFSADDAMRQDVDNQVADATGRQEQDFDWIQNLKSAGSGALFGSVLVNAPMMLGKIADNLNPGTLFSGIDPTAIGKGIVDDVKEVIQSVIEQYPNAEPLIPYLSSREIRMLDRPRSGKLIDNTLAVINDFEKIGVTADEMADVAFAGKAKRGWYQKSGEYLSEIFLDDFPRFAALLAATSPQTSVKSNLKNALSIWTNWDAAGRPTDKDSIIAIMGSSVEGDKGVDSVLGAWINNSVSALTEPEDQLLLSGAKVDSFMRNIMGDSDAVTADTWMANYFGTEQAKFSGGKKESWPGNPGQTKSYMAVSAITRKAAKLLSKRRGETWTPAEIQETVWSYVKVITEMRRNGDKRSIVKIIESGDVSDEVIRGAEDFATMLGDPDIKTIIKDTDYGRRAEGVTSSSGGAFGPQSGNEPASSGTSAARARAAKNLRRTGRRLEQGEQARKEKRSQ